MSKLIVNNLSCQKGYNLLFENLSFEINSGEVLKVSGANGSGKTSVSYTHLRAHETGRNLVCRLLLEIGMTKNQVMDLIGSPSIIDPFHQYQWDYINHSSIEGETKIQYRLRLIFDGNILAEIDKTGLSGLLVNN